MRLQTLRTLGFALLGAAALSACGDDTDPANMVDDDDGMSTTTTGGGVTITTTGNDGEDTLGTTTTTTGGADETAGTTDAEDATGTTTGAAVEPTEATVQEVQNGTIETDTLVTLSHPLVVTAVHTNGFAAQHLDGGEYSAVWVFTGNDPALENLAVGNQVSVTGVTEEYTTPGGGDGFTQINVLDHSWEVTDAGVTEVSAAVITAAALAADAGEPWEGVFVRIEDTLTVTGIEFYELLVTTDNGATLIDNYLYSAVDEDEDFPNLTQEEVDDEMNVVVEEQGVGATFDAVQGIVNFTFGNYKIAPRSADDFGTYTQAPE